MITFTQAYFKFTLIIKIRFSDIIIDSSAFLNELFIEAQYSQWVRT